MQLPLFIKLTTGLFAVLNPLGAVPMFVSLTSNRTDDERVRIARMAAFTVFVVLTVSLLCGEPLLDTFGISLASFRVGGGILLLLMAIAMLHAKRSGAKNAPEETVEAMSRTEIAVVPLGMPLLAGPGTISTAILYRTEIRVWSDTLLLVAMMALISVATYLLLRYAAPLIAKLGRTGLNIFMRVMGLILAALAIEFMANGLKGLFPMLGR